MPRQIRPWEFLNLFKLTIPGEKNFLAPGSTVQDLNLVSGSFGLNAGLAPEFLKRFLVPRKLPVVEMPNRTLGAFLIV